MFSILFVLMVVFGVFILPTILSYSVLRSIYVDSTSNVDKAAMWIMSIFGGWLVCFIVFPIITVCKVFDLKHTVTKAELLEIQKELEENRRK